MLLSKAVMPAKDPTSSGMQLRTMELHRPSLDDVFLRKTGRSLRETAA